MPSFEVLLPIGAIGFYVFDSALMLYADEIVLTRSGAGWSSADSLRLQFAGRRLYLPNPFTPARLLFRVHWSGASAADGNEGLDVGKLQDATSIPRFIVTLQMLLLFLVLPPVSILFGAGAGLLVVFAVFYALTLAALAVVVVRRADLRLTGRQCALLSLEILACAPFAANLVRKLSLVRSPELRWLALAERTFTAAEKAELERSLTTRIDELLVVEEPDSASAARLNAFRQHLQERLDVPVRP